MIERTRKLWWWVQHTRVWRTFSHFTDVGGNVLTAGMSYQAMFAVFAALWLGFSIFGIVLLGRPELLASLIDQINLFVPGLIGEEGLVRPSSLEDLARGSSVTSAIAGVALLWVALNWFTGTRRAIRIIFGLDVKQYRNAALLKLRDLTLALLFAVALIISAALTVLSTNVTEQLYRWLGWDQSSWLFSTLGEVARYGALYVFDVLVLMAMHRLLAEVEVPFMRLLSGCAIGGAAMLGLKILGTAVLGGATSNPLLVSFGLLIAVLIWFNFIFRALLLTSSWVATGLDQRLGEPSEREPGRRK